MLISGRLSGPQARPAATATARGEAERAADRLMEERGIPQDEHVLLRENLASCLFNGGASAERDASSRWGRKLARDLERPYSDAQVFERLSVLEQRVQELSLHSLPGATWFVCGGMAKGRFGANSDVDLTCDGAFRPDQLAALKGLAGWEAAEFKAEFQSGDPQRLFGSARHGEDVSAVLVSGALLERKLQSYDAAVPVELQHGFLADVYVAALAKKGFRVERDACGGVQVSGGGDVARVPEREWARCAESEGGRPGAAGG